MANSITGRSYQQETGKVWWWLYIPVSSSRGWQWPRENIANGFMLAIANKVCLPAVHVLYPRILLRHKGGSYLLPPFSKAGMRGCCILRPVTEYHPFPQDLMYHGPTLVVGTADTRIAISTPPHSLLIIPTVHHNPASHSEVPDLFPWLLPSAREKWLRGIQTVESFNQRHHHYCFDYMCFKLFLKNNTCVL